MRPSLVSHCVATEKITYIKDDDTYHTLKSVGVLLPPDRVGLEALHHELLGDVVWSLQDDGSSVRGAEQHVRQRELCED